MKKLGFYLSAAFLLALPDAAQAKAVKYLFDQPHTQVLFFIDHMGFAKSQGEFEQTDGYILIDTNAPEMAEVNVTIPISSLDMDDKPWEDHLKGADFFDIEKFPNMTFVGTNVERTGEDTAALTGDLTIHGITQPVTLDVVFNKAGKHPMNGKDVIGFSATGLIKRSDFGMEYGLPMVGDDVELRIEVEAYSEESSAEEASSNNTGNE